MFNFKITAYAAVLLFSTLKARRLFQKVQYGHTQLHV